MALPTGRSAGELLRAYYVALDEPALDALDDLLAAGCEWTFPGVRLRGPAAVREQMARTLALGLSMQHDIRLLVEDGDTAMCELVATNRLPGEEYVVSGAVVCQANEGRIIRLAAYPEAEAMTAFLAGLRRRAAALRGPG